ncbi:MFS transporter [Paeniglutamicibacter sp.]|uniref:MFS transporter n=1 Tax=Paeniglutamicibacter sp. TaxID=1934391 RepID=UPI003989340B
MSSQPNASINGSPGLLAPEFRWVTLGMFTLVFLVAFESLAVTTVMPLVSAELDGSGLYALAFAAPMASGVIGMVAAGSYSDRHGPVLPLYVSCGIFVLGLLVCGLSPNMEMLVAGRLVQGLGGGAITVALYVVVARAYVPRLHPQIFAAFAAAWVVPSLIGPFAAGLVAQTIGWRWVFLGVVGLVVLAMAAVVPSVRGLGGGENPEAAFGWRSLGWATLAAAAVLGLNLAARVPVLGPALMALAVVMMVLAVRPLLPRGSLLAARGLPATILVRGLTAAAFFGTEVYLPYLLIQRFGLGAAIAGLALTGGAICWSLGSAIQGRMGERLSNELAMLIGSALGVGAIVLVLATAAFHLPALVAILAWAMGGGGMGLVYPRQNVHLIKLSTTANQGFNSSALAVSDSLGSALALAVGGLVFGAFSGNDSFTAVFVFTAAIGALLLLITPRVRSKVPSHAEREDVATLEP